MLLFPHDMHWQSYKRRSTTGQLHVLPRSLQGTNHVQDVTMAQGVIRYGYQSGARESEVAQPGRTSPSKRRKKIGARNHKSLVFNVYVVPCICLFCPLGVLTLPQVQS